MIDFDAKTFAALSDNLISSKATSVPPHKLENVLIALY
jgi:hypothetical protein